VQYAISVEILSTAAQLHDDCHLKKPHMISY